MGSVLAQSVEGIKNPSVGLLNIGSEAVKGSELIKRASQLIAESGLNYHGFVEGDDIYKGKVNVIVSDGFVGNVSLKTGEGLAALVNALRTAGFEVGQTQAGPAPVQRCELARTQWNRDQEPRQRGYQFLSERDSNREHRG